MLTMRKLLALLIVAVAILAAPGSALASAPSCSTKTNQITSWSIQSDSVSGTVNTQCGGAQPGNQGDYYVKYNIQWLDAGVTWYVFNCDNGGICQNTKPSTGLFSGGNPHSFNWTFNVAGQIDCRQIKAHTEIVFPLYQPDPGYTISWNGPTNQVGC